MADYKSTTSENKCIFCEIIKGNIKTPGIFWEDGEFMAFLSTWPNTIGFTVVVPKDHYKLFTMHNTEHLKNDSWKQHHSKNDKFFEHYEGYISSNDGPKADEQEL